MSGWSLPVEVEQDDLGTLSSIGSGGQGEVFDLPDYRPAGVPWPLVYKRYHQREKQRSSITIPTLRQIVETRTTMQSPVRELVDRRMAWPLQAAKRNGEPTGFIMRRVEDRFFHHISLPFGGMTRELREAQWLHAPEIQCQEVGVPFPALSLRLVVCAQFAELLAVLHEHRDGLVYGDLNPKNVLYDLAGDDSIFLIDCDAVRRRGSSAAVTQLTFPDWQSPEGGASRHTDAYKFGLFVVRTLAPRQFIGSIRTSDGLRRHLSSLGPLVDDIVEYVDKSLSNDAQARPSLRDWADLFATGGRPRSQSWSPPPIMSTSSAPVAPTTNAIPPVPPTYRPWRPPTRSSPLKQVKKGLARQAPTKVNEPREPELGVDEYQPWRPPENEGDQE